MVSFLTLDVKGIILAVVFGVVILFSGKDMSLFFLFDLFLFLALSAIVTRLGKVRKKKIGVYEHFRGWKNVIANGIVPVAISVVYFINYSQGFLPRSFIAIAYVASVAAVTADKFASEVGILEKGNPTMLMTLKKVKKGTSGGVNLLGVGSAFLASLIVSVSVLYLGGSWALVGAVAISGLFGDIVDSILGYYEEQGVGNKYTSNFFCSLTGALACLFMLI